MSLRHWSTVCILSAILVPYSLTSTDATWTNGAMTGAWNNNGNWTGGVFPNASNDIARFEGAGPPGSVSLNTLITLGTLNITASGYSIVPGGGSLRFMTSGADAALNSVASQITAPIALVQVTFSLAYNGEFGIQYWSQEGIIRLEKDF